MPVTDEPLILGFVLVANEVVMPDGIKSGATSSVRLMAVTATLTVVPAENEVVPDVKRQPAGKPVGADDFPHSGRV